MSGQRWPHELFLRRAEADTLAERVAHAGDMCLTECTSEACAALRRLVELAKGGR